jgi:hypothetical protein
MSKAASSESSNQNSPLTHSEDYIQTLGVNFMEKTINIRNTEITFSVSESLDARTALTRRYGT